MSQRVPIPQHQRHGMLTAVTLLRQKLQEQTVSGCALIWFGTDDTQGGASLFAAGDIAEALRISGMALGVAIEACQPSAMRDTSTMMDDEPLQEPLPMPESEKGDA